MRVGFFGQAGPFAPPALRYLLANSGGFEIVLVVEGKKQVAGRMDHRLRKPRVGPLPEGNHLSELARAAGIPVLETCDVNAATAVRTLSEAALDWIVCVGFDRLFSPGVLATAGHALNAHPSLLPRWRGPSPLFWALKAGERNLGVTIHGVDEKEDHGPIYSQMSFVAPRRATGEELYGVAAAVAAPILVDVLARARAGTLVGLDQDHRHRTRAPRPRAEDVYVDPETWDCEHLVDFCSAAPFFRAPWLRFGDDVFFVRRGLAADLGRRLPAQYALSGAMLIVQCRDGLARLEVQV